MPELSVTVHPLSLRVLDDELIVERASRAIPPSLQIDDELLVGVVCAPDSTTVVRRPDPEDEDPPPAIWRAFYAQAGHGLDLPGVLVGVLAPLANAGIGVFVLSTIDRDLVLVPEDRVGAAADALRLAGHSVTPGA